MSDFDIQIKVDPTQAVSGVSRVTSELGKLESEAHETSAALQSSLTSAGKAAGDTATKIEDSGNAMESAFGKTKGALDGVGSLLTGGAIGAGILALGSQVSDLIESYEKLDDQYTNLYNHALKFTDAEHNVNAVLAQQSELALKLHSTLGEALDAYDAVQDATVDLNLSQRELVAATQAVGEASVISGKSMSGAGEVLNRMILAMDSGADSGRALKTALVGYDEISDILTKHFGTTRAGLVELANQHKITSRDIVDAFIQESDAEQEKYDKRKLTFEQEKAIIGERLALYRKDTGDMTAMFEAGDPVLRNADLTMRSWGGTLDDDSRATRFLTDEVKRFGQQLDDLKNKTNAAVRDGTAGFVKGIVDVGKGVTSAVSNYDELAKKLGLVDPWKVATEATKDHIDHALTPEEEMLKRLHGAYDQAYKDLATIEILYAKNKVTLGEYNDEIARNKDILGTPVNSVTGGHVAAPDFGDLPAGKTADVAAQRQAEAQLAALKKAGVAYDEYEFKARDALSGIDSGWKQIVLDATDSGKHIRDAMTSAFTDIQSSLEDMVMKGKLDLGSLASSLESILVKLAVQQATGSLIGALGGGRVGFDYMTPSGPGPALPGFATGGDMLVGGAGAPDSKLAMFRVSPGESIHVRTPEQRAAASTAGGAGGGTVNHNYFTFDPKALNKSIDSGVQKYIKENRTAVRALLGV